jgi:hypothetical protein
MDERGGHKDLRGSAHRSVIPYIHGRTELYCTSLLESVFLTLTDLSIDPCEEASAQAFNSSRSSSYIETRAPTGAPEVVETIYNI